MSWVAISSLRRFFGEVVTESAIAFIGVFDNETKRLCRDKELLC